MPGYRTANANFTKGVISPSAEARFDIAIYNAAVRRARNVQVQRTGGLKKRMGTRYVTQALSSSSFLIPFQFSNEQAYVQEYAQAIMRPMALGGTLLETGLKITAITKAAQANITAAFHGYAVGDQVYLKSDNPTAFGMREILNRELYVVSVQSSSQFTVNINSTNFTAFGVDTGQVNSAPPAPPPTPPAVPPPSPPPTPPPVGSGSNGGYEDDGSGGFGWTGGPGQIP